MEKTAKEPPWFCDHDFVQSVTDLKLFFKLNENVIYLLIPLGIIDIYCLKNFNYLLHSLSFKNNSSTFYETKVLSTFNILVEKS